MKKLNKTAMIVTLSLCLNTITNIFIETFLVAKILNLSNNNVMNVGIFFVVNHFCLSVFYILLSSLAKKIKHSWLMISGIILKLVIILFVILLNDSIINYIVILAVLNGISEALYWVSANLFKTNSVEHKQMKTFITYVNIIGKIVSIVFPILLAYCIDNFSFKITAIIVIIISAIQLGLTIFIKIDSEPNKQTKYKEFLQTAKISGYLPILKQSYLSCFLRGLKNNTIYLITYLTVLVFNTNMSLGIFSTIISILSILVMYLYNLFSKNKKANILTTICAVTSSFSIILVAFILNKTTLIIFNIIFSISISVVDNINESRRLNLTKHLNLENYTIENQVLCETALNIGRIISEFMLIIIGLLTNETITVVMLLITAIFIAMYSIYVNHVENNVNKFDFKNAKIKIEEYHNLQNSIK